jgi:peptidoglycan LD-endopeptidase CwlK
MPKFGAASEKELATIHPDLQRVFRRAILNAPIDFRIIQGLRDRKQQLKNVANGASQTLNSRHLAGGGSKPKDPNDTRAYAGDIVALISGKVSWHYNHYTILAAHIKKAAAIEGVPIVWGGDWKSLKDGAHFELDRKRYP